MCAAEHRRNVRIPNSRAFVLFACLATIAVSSPRGIHPVIATDQVGVDPDDPAIWLNVSDPQHSLILGTDKADAPDGALFVFGLDGKVRTKIGGLDRPNNVDVAYGLVLGSEKVDIAVVTERQQHRLRVYRIFPDGSKLAEIGLVPVFEGEQGERASPMGIGLYQRSRDRAVFAIVSRKTGPSDGYLWQYRLLSDGKGRVRGELVRKFGKYSGTKEIEAIAVDSPLGYVYYADELFGIRKYHADPDHPDAARELSVFGKEGFEQDREGIAIYARADGTGYIICTDQIARNSIYRVFRREGTRANPHDHAEVVKVVPGSADSTDGIEVTSMPLGPEFPHGILVAMNSRPRNFVIFNWDDIAGFGGVKLQKGRK